MDKERLFAEWLVDVLWFPYDMTVNPPPPIDPVILAETWVEHDGEHAGTVSDYLFGFVLEIPEWKEAVSALESDDPKLAARAKELTAKPRVRTA